MSIIMGTPEEILQTVVRAVSEKLTAERKIDEALTTSRASMRELYHEHSMSAPDISDRARRALLAAGFSEADIQGAGLGQDNIRKVVGSRQRV